MMPRLAAGETLEAATATALGTGAMEKGDAARVRGELERQADAGRRPARATPAVLAMMGIGVHVAPPKKADA